MSHELYTTGPQFSTINVGIWVTYSLISIADTPAIWPRSLVSCRALPMLTVRLVLAGW